MLLLPRNRKRTYVPPVYVKYKEKLGQSIYIIQGEAHKVLQSDSTQTIDYIQK